MNLKIALDVDTDADAAYIRLTTEPIVRTVELNDEVSIDLDEFGVAVGVEVLALNAEIPFTELHTLYHVHSEVIQHLQSIRPTVASFMSLSTGTDGEAAVRPRLILEPHLATC